MSQEASILPVLMCGGSGTRLWPLSRGAVPKQFVSLVSDRSLLRDTCARIAPFAGRRWIAVTNVAHRFLVAEQLRSEGIDGATILLEPIARNTAPAIAVAALEALASGEDPVLVVLPSDHVIRDQEAFGRALAHAVSAAMGGALATFGVVPTGPATGYGYIRGGEIDESSSEALAALGARPVAQFVEKPDCDTAAAYLASGAYYWNSGMFVFRATRYLEELERHRPEMLHLCRRAFEARSSDADFTRLAEDPFTSIRAESVDYAVMEHTDQAVVVPLDAEWNDVGSWEALWDLSDHDTHGNAVRGDVVAVDVRNSYLHAAGPRLVAAVGLEDTIVVDTPDALLVAARARAQEVKEVVDRLRAQEREEAQLPARVLRPWGDYQNLDVGPGYQVKRITVKPAARLSIQKHRHRAEHWTVVQGTARVLCDDRTFALGANESTFLPTGCVHRLENPGTEPLIVIEVQYGDYLGEDDIIRFEDDYGRAGTS